MGRSNSFGEEERWQLEILCGLQESECGNP